MKRPSYCTLYRYRESFSISVNARPKEGVARYSMLIFQHTVKHMQWAPVDEGGELSRRLTTQTGTGTGTLPEGGTEMCVCDTCAHKTVCAEELE